MARRLMWLARRGYRFPQPRYRPLYPSMLSHLKRRFYPFEALFLPDVSVSGPLLRPAPVSVPQQCCKTIDKLPFYNRAGIKFCVKLCTQGIKLPSVFTLQHNFLGRKSMLSAFIRDRALPASLFGPVLSFAFALFASSCLRDTIETSPRSKDQLFSELRPATEGCLD